MNPNLDSIIENALNKDGLEFPSMHLSCCIIPLLYVWARVQDTVVGCVSGLNWCTGLVYHWTASDDNLQLLSCTTCVWNSLLLTILCIFQAYC